MNYWWFLLIFILLLAAPYYFKDWLGGAKDISWTEFQQEMMVNQDVEKVVVVNRDEAEVYIRKDRRGKGRYATIGEEDPGPHYKFTIGSIDNFERNFYAVQESWPENERIKIDFVKRTDWTGSILAWVLPLAIIVGLWLFIFNRMRPGNVGGRNMFDFGKAKTTEFVKTKSSINFDDIAGMDEVKVEVKEIVDFLKNPERFTRLGAKIPKGVILIGPPGTGKTLLAKAVAGEANVPFFSMSGSEFVEMFVGVGASRVRDLFKRAKESAPSIVFIDEIDAIGRSRGKAASLQANDERENTLNQLLAEMDGFAANTGVIVMAATNRGEILDRALLRPGRFDRQIFLNLPTLTERKAIFRVHFRPLKLADDIDLDTLAARTPGFSGADIANICNEAALIAARLDKSAVGMKDFYEAADRVIAGLERKSKIISSEEKEIIAYHEAGHAAVSWFLPHADSLLKVSIIPRGKSLGAAWYLPQEHQIYTRTQFMDKLAVAMGGRAAEEVVFGEISSNALDDLEKATKQAFMMVAYYGLDESIGNVSYYDSTGQYEQSLHKPYSEATARKIDQRVSLLVECAYDRAKKMLIAHREELDQLARRLLKKETVYKKDMEEVFGLKSEGV